MAEPADSHASPHDKSLTRPHLLLDAVLVIACFILLYSILKQHVPSRDPEMIRLWAAITSACMTGVFWLALQMYHVVYRYQRAERRAQKN